MFTPIQLKRGFYRQSHDSDGYPLTQALRFDHVEGSDSYTQALETTRHFSHVDFDADDESSYVFEEVSYHDMMRQVTVAMSTCGFAPWEG